MEDHGISAVLASEKAKLLLNKVPAFLKAWQTVISVGTAHGG